MIGSKELVRQITETNPADNEMAVWWLGQIGYAIKMAGKVIYIDAYLGNDSNRMFPPNLDAEDIDNADIVIGTHDHMDHIDYATWAAIGKNCPKAVFVASKLYTKKLSEITGIALDRFIGINDGDTLQIDGITIRGIASAHEFLDIDAETGFYPYMGYAVSGGGVSFYHAGDCCPYPELSGKIRAFGEIDLMFLPINGRDDYRYTHNCAGNFTFQEAVDLAGSVGPRYGIPAHYAMHSFNTEDPYQFKNYLDHKYPPVKGYVMVHSEGIVYNKEKGIVSSTKNNTL